MFDRRKLAGILALYKTDFKTVTWDDERYKWEAVKHFQDNWDVNAVDFAAMLDESLSECGNLLTTANRFPKGMIVQSAKRYPERVRSMFLDLFDEGKDYWERISRFKAAAFELHEEMKGPGTKLNHYQDENVITTYLWLRYPDRYYIYKYGEVRRVAKELGANWKIKKGAYASNVRNHLAFYDELCAALQEDPDLAAMLAEHVDGKCYPDPELRTLTIDVGFYISRYLHKFHGADVQGGEGASKVDATSEGNSDGVFADAPGEDGAHEVDAGPRNYWWVTAKPSHWSWDSIAVNEVVDYTAYNESGNKRRIFKHFEAAMPGDLVVGYHSTPELRVACFGVVEEGLDVEPTDCILIRKTRLPDHDLTYAEMKADAVLAKMEYIAGNPTGTIFSLTEEEYERIVELTCDAPRSGGDFEPYGREDFLRDVYMSPERYDHLVAVLRNKKNVILQGAPGVGKTFAANRLAWSMMGAKDEDRIEFIQFHQSYSYEDFMMGYKPAGEGFELRHGVFYRFCQRAANNPGEEHFFIIDEINRGNMSKIFGELLMLIEADYRGTKATLAYNGLPFSVPKNLFIIGMMNTADRSLAMIDYALRRRFSFFDMESGFDTEGFTEYREGLGSETIDELVGKVCDLNAEIARDKSLGRGFCIGHSYFCGRSADEDAEAWGRQVVDFDIMPMLREYWFDDEAKVMRWDYILHGVFQ